MKYTCIYCLTNFKKENVYNLHLKYCRYACNCAWCQLTRLDEDKEFEVMYLNKSKEKSKRIETFVDSCPDLIDSIQKIKIDNQTAEENQKEHTIIDIESVYPVEELIKKKKKPNKFVWLLQKMFSF